MGECTSFGVAHKQLGQVIEVVATPPQGVPAVDAAALLAECRRRMPAYLVPAGVEWRQAPLPPNPNGKIARKLISKKWLEMERR